MTHNTIRFFYSNLLTFFSLSYFTQFLMISSSGFNFQRLWNQFRIYFSPHILFTVCGELIFHRNRKKRVLDLLRIKCEQYFLKRFYRARNIAKQRWIIDDCWDLEGCIMWSVLEKTPLSMGDKCDRKYLLLDKKFIGFNLWWERKRKIPNDVQKWAAFVIINFIHKNIFIGKKIWLIFISSIESFHF